MLRSEFNNLSDNQKKMKVKNFLDNAKVNADGAYIGNKDNCPDGMCIGALCSTVSDQQKITNRKDKMGYGSTDLSIKEKELVVSSDAFVQGGLSPLDLPMV